jgi:GT2 family glycosyltransferase
MKVDIVIVNWNSGAQLIECLDSIELFHANFVSRVVIVDNASSDNSLPEKSYLGFPVEIIKNSTNTGFSRACNVGARICHSELILFLNPDTKLYADTLSLSIQFFNNDLNSEIGVLGVKSIGSKPNEVNRHCARFPTPSMYFYHSTGLANFFPKFFSRVHLADFDHLTNRAVDHVIGAYYMMRRSLFDYLGGFDERYFVYIEDLDFSLRVKQSGKVVYYLADAAIFHIHDPLLHQLGEGAAHRLQLKP